MGQRAKILTQILDIRGWKVTDAIFEWKPEDPRNAAERVDLRLNPRPSPWTTRLILQLSRRFTARCGICGRLCSQRHSGTRRRRFRDHSWSGFEVWLDYEPERVVCDHCHQTPVEQLPFADPYQHETKRFQQTLTVEAASMPTLHVSERHGLSWATVRRIEEQAIARWEATRPKKQLRMGGLDEKFLGRRGKSGHRFVTVVSDLETGEPIAIEYGRDEAAVKRWLDTLTAKEKANIKLFAMDMHEPFWNAIDNDPLLDHVAITHDPFHIMKRANEAVDELRRAVFFRAGTEMRNLGTGARWLFLKASEKCTRAERKKLHKLLSMNDQLATGYQVKEELRDVLRAPDRQTIEAGLNHLLRRTQRRANKPLRKLHDSLNYHWNEIVALAEYRPPVGRIEALNNNWEALVRRGRGYRDHAYLLRKLRFMVANPIRTGDGLRRFIALGDPSAVSVLAKAA
jgi:transposase